MYQNNGGPIGAAKECRRDLEAEAKRGKKQLDTFQKFQNSISDFIKSGNLYWFDDNSDRRVILAVIGALSIEIPQMEKNYESILKEIESDQRG